MTWPDDIKPEQALNDIDLALLCWARAKAATPFEWCHDHVRCAFCGQQQALMWNGVMAAHHTDTCLAARVNEVKP